MRPADRPEAVVGLDERTFASLYEETFAAVFRYAYVLTGNASLAEDVAADVYLRAWQYRQSFRADGSPLSWLLSITHNCAVRGRNPRPRAKSQARTASPRTSESRPMSIPSWRRKRSESNWSSRSAC